jgi:hydroxymethylglutaryl-CoA lyase
MSVRELGLPARVPATEPAGSLPRRVTIWEVGPRDGLQNEKTAVGLDTKLEFLGRLADADELLARLDRRPGIDYPVLVPNEPRLYVTIT